MTLTPRLTISGVARCRTAAYDRKINGPLVSYAERVKTTRRGYRGFGFEARRPFMAGIHRMTNANASDAHRGHWSPVCNRSQSRQSRASRRCMDTPSACSWSTIMRPGVTRVMPSARCAELHICAPPQGSQRHTGDRQSGTRSRGLVAINSCLTRIETDAVSDTRTYLINPKWGW